MAIGKDPSFTPVVQRLALLVVEERDDALLVEDIGLLADEWSLHLVDGLLEELFVFANQQFLDALEATFALRD